MMHVHDYEMQFKEDTLNYRLVCRCGDVAPDMWTAVQRTARSTKRNGIACITIAFVSFIVLVALVLWVKNHEDNFAFQHRRTALGHHADNILHSKMALPRASASADHARQPNGPEQFSH